MPPDGTETLVPRHPTAQRLIDAAIRAMDADGEAGLRVDAIVADAGVTIPVLYHHFGNREGLVRAAHVARLRQNLDQAIDDLELALTLVHDRAGFVAMFDALLERVMLPNRERYIRVNVLGATFGRPDLQAEVAELQRQRWATVAEMLAEPQRKGWIRADLDLVVFVGWLFGLVMSRVLMDLQEGAMETSAWDEYTLAAVHTVMYGPTDL
jgi:AcrR family transcriptional regulator